MAWDWKSALMGLLGGAGTGVGAGSLGGPLGAGIGGAVGAGLGLLGGGLAGGKKGGVQQAPRFNPQQQAALNFLLQSGQGNIQDPYKGFAPIEDYARMQFQQQTLPSIAERFSSMGDNALTSGAYGSQLAGSGVELEKALAAMRAQYGLQNQQQGLNLLALGLSPAFDSYYQGSQPGFGETILSGALQSGPKFYEAYQQKQALKKLQDRLDSIGM